MRPGPEGRGPQRPYSGRPSRALLERADRGYARFLAHTDPADPDDSTGDHHVAAAGAAGRRIRWCPWGG
ncbi:hypothetical protein ABZ353_09490 [Streptomyces niveus]|uniref:hypothetical protein n=1 Tax=Streptomyces niveus TaxID=193462 RepID=UPI0033C4E2B9